VRKILVVLIVSCLSLFAFDATIDIVKKGNKLPKIVVQDATDNLFADKFIEKKMFKLLVGDLKISANFIVDDRYIKTSYEGDYKENFQSNVMPDLIARFKLESRDNILMGYMKLINAKNGSVIVQNIYKISNKKRYPFLAHRMIIDINNKLGAPSIEWMQRFVVFAKYTGKKKSDIVISDYTLSYQKTIVTGGLNIFPKWANQEQNAFYYSSYNGRTPVLYKVDLIKGKRYRIISSKGMLVCSDVSKDGSKLVLTMAPNDQPDIYLYDLKTKKLERLTKFRGIDVSGNFIDNETRIAFVSDRLGYPNIFAKRLHLNAPVEQLVYQGKNNNSFSSYENYLVFSRREGDSEFGKNSFNLYLISTKTEYIRQLTATGKNYFPRFANKGETIMFIKNYKRQSALGIIRLYSNKSFLFPLKVGRIQSLDW
jgi:TolB protein